MNLSEFFNIYFLSIFIIGLSLFFLLLQYLIKGTYPNHTDKLLFFLSIIFYIFLFGLRSDNIGTDTVSYLRDFNVLSNFKTFEYALDFSKLKRDYFFVVFTFSLAQIVSKGVYLWILAAIYMGGIYLVIKKFTFKYRLFVFLSFLCFSFFYSMGINIIRNGISTIFSLLGLIYIFEIGLKTNNSKLRKIQGGIFFLIGYLFHSSAVLFLLPFVVIRFLKFKIIWYYLVTLFFYVLAFLKFSLLDIPIIGPIVEVNERMTSYISGDASQEATGFNLYTVVFQTLGALYGAYFIWKDKNKEYIIINKFYLVLTCVYMFCLQISFSDRFGVLSWIFLPLILSIPFIYKKERFVKSDFFIYLLTFFSYLILTYYRIGLE